MKQKYIAPEMRIVRTQTQYHLLSGSNTMGINGEANSETVVESRRRGSFWDDEE